MGHKDGTEYSYVTSELTVDTIHLDWCRANPTVKLDIKETHLDYEGKLWSVWNDGDVMHWTEVTIVRKFGDEIVYKVQECKANPDVRLDTPGARGKLETSLTLSNSPLISGIDGGSTIDENESLSRHQVVIVCSTAFAMHSPNLTPSQTIFIKTCLPLVRDVVSAPYSILFRLCRQADDVLCKKNQI